eukprot:730530-Prymnesium_polylepis.1
MRKRRTLLHVALSSPGKLIRRFGMRPCAARWQPEDAPRVGRQARAHQRQAELRQAALRQAVRGSREAESHLQEVSRPPPRCTWPTLSPKTTVTASTRGWGRTNPRGKQPSLPKHMIPE